MVEKKSNQRREKQSKKKMSTTSRAASSSRKHVMSGVLSECPEPDFEQGPRVGTIVESKGGNQFTVEYAESGGADSGLKQLQCRLPSKFLNKIWIKRGDFVIIDSQDPTILHALYPKQIDHLQTAGIWPSVFPSRKVAVKPAASFPSTADGDDDSNDDDSNDDDSNNEIFKNTNRRAPNNDSDSGDDSDDSSSNDD